MLCSVSVCFLLLVLLKCNGDQLSPLLVDVTWVIQGTQFGFQGFVVEFLGLTSSLRRYLPYLRVTQSNFRKSFSDLAMQNMSNFVSLMFTKEGDNFHWLYSRNSSTSLELESEIRPKYQFGVIAAINSDICEYEEDFYVVERSDENIASRNHDNHYYEHDSFILGGTMGRSYIPLATSSHSCCLACKDEPLCVGWTYFEDKMDIRNSSFMDGYNDGFVGCQLRGTLKDTSTVVVPGAVSGRFNTATQVKRMITPRFVILHGTTCIHNNQSVVNSDPNTIYIGRYMIERNKLVGGLNADETAVVFCASRVEEVWVPTEWHKTAFLSILKSYGFPFPSVAVVPEAVDAELFDPTFYPKKEDKKIGDIMSCKALGGACDIGSDLSSRFNFISIFKWEYRKGWDILLDAYWKAFKKSDPVVLRLRTYLPSMWPGSSNITQSIIEYCGSRGLVYEDQALVVWESGESVESRSEAVTRVVMRDLLASADAFVLPTRGEGWGLPIAEAMAMELPVLVTNYSGPTAFINEDNAYLIPVKPQFDKYNFAQPDADALAELMLKVIEDSGPSGITRMKGQRARKEMIKFSPDFVTRVILERMRVLLEKRGWVEPPFVDS